MILALIWTIQAIVSYRHLKISGGSTSGSETSVTLPSLCYEAIQLRAGQFVHFMRSRERTR